MSILSDVTQVAVRLHGLLEPYRDSDGKLIVHKYKTAIKHNHLNFSCLSSFLEKNNTSQHLTALQRFLLPLPPLEVFHNCVQTKTSEKPIYDFYPNWLLKKPSFYHDRDWETLKTRPKNSAYQPTNMQDLTIVWRSDTGNTNCYRWADLSAFFSALCKHDWWNFDAERTLRLSLQCARKMTNDTKSTKPRILRFPKIGRLHLDMVIPPGAQDISLVQEFVIQTEANSISLGRGSGSPFQLVAPNLHVLDIRPNYALEWLNVLNTSSFFTVVFNTDSLWKTSSIENLARWLYRHKALIKSRDQFSLLCAEEDYEDIVFYVGRGFRSYIKTPKTMSLASPPSPLLSANSF